MEFEVSNVKLTNFRNHQNKQFGPFSKINIFVGPNGVGKSNILEAINLTTSFSSFRHAKTENLINIQNNEFGLIETEIINCSTKIKHSIKLQLQTRSKKTLLDNKKISISKLKGKYPSVSFCPDDLMYIKSRSSDRRQLIDTLGSQLSQNYYTVRKDYSKTLRNKNRLLKEGTDKQLLQSLNDVLVITGAQLICYRKSLIDKLNPLLNYNNSMISDSDETVNINYKPCFSNKSKQELCNRDNIRKSLKLLFQDNLDLEIISKHCVVGPHKDRFSFEINSCDSSNFASQGQQRSITLAFKLSEVQLIKDILNCKPILLLDDVMSELDKNRSKSLLDIVKCSTQTFITTTSLDCLQTDFLEKSKVFQL